MQIKRFVSIDEELGLRAKYSMRETTDLLDDSKKVGIDGALINLLVFYQLKTPFSFRQIGKAYAQYDDTKCYLHDCYILDFDRISKNLNRYWSVAWTWIERFLQQRGILKIFTYDCDPAMPYEKYRKFLLGRGYKFRDYHLNKANIMIKLLN